MTQPSIALRVPVRITESYSRPGDEMKLFPTCSNYLTRDEVYEAFPSGIITHERFTHAGLVWRLLCRRANNGAGPLQYLAVLDDAPLQGQNAATPGTSTSSRRAISHDGGAGTPPHGQSAALASGLSSRPLMDLVESEPATHPNSATESPVTHVASMPSLTSPAHPTVLVREVPHSPGQSQLHQRNSFQSNAPGATSTALALPLPPMAQYGAAASTHVQVRDRNKFIEDLLTASDSPIPMERYKALIRLMSALRRQQAHARISQPARVQSWDSPEHLELLKQIIMVGECLARFGTAEFDQRSNTSRAINTKDYATLLTQYLEFHGSVFSMDFISQLPQALQDEALGVRSLLQTRCEANSIIFGQLIKHVGLESQGTGSAVVYNNSLVTANPTNVVHNSPKMMVKVAQQAVAQAWQKRSTKLGAAAVGAVLALFIMKRKFFGGGRRRGRGSDDAEEWYESSRRRRGGREGGGTLSFAERVFGGRQSSERMAMAHIAACTEELQRAQHNMELLASDWRLGHLRLAAPASGPYPPGYEPLNMQRCTLHTFIQSLENPHGVLAAPPGSGVPAYPHAYPAGASVPAPRATPVASLTAPPPASAAPVPPAPVSSAPAAKGAAKDQKVAAQQKQQQQQQAPQQELLQQAGASMAAAAAKAMGSVPSALGSLASQIRSAAAGPASA